MTEPHLAVRLPDISTLRRRCQALAMLDAILCPEWEYRYYSYDQAWAVGHRLALMRDGSGNEYSIVFSPAGAVIRGLAVDAEPAPDLTDGMPATLESSLAKLSEHGLLKATVLLWRERSDPGWNDVNRPVDERSEALFELLTAGSSEAYHRFAQDYYEVGLDADAVARVFAHAPLTEELIHRLTRHARIEDIIDDCATIGWALSGRVPANH